MRIGILGPLEVRDADGQLLPVGGARLRSLLIRLAIGDGQAVAYLDKSNLVGRGSPREIPDLPNSGVCDQVRSGDPSRHRVAVAIGRRGWSGSLLTATRHCIKLVAEFESLLFVVLLRGPGEFLGRLHWLRS